ncbi:hypothetical protein FNH13_17365 [Ornithinimicrobium ciconiae]|uniref:DUF3558 domain-containing protein n=1 Tax=Ornithinimicrobium ciconiae TaxID=2594265 RepID=A0A516GEB5_9MICO|nr:hypothetical protein [Ornithinimicrobium ciconiae]QDO89877.1 hypothetical protein FNH13_17365 [Ornithinimicrobium ciconiae]
MQRRTTLSLSLVLLAASALTACTSGEDPAETTTTAGPTSEGAPTQNPDWFCRLIASEAVDAVTDGRSAEAREVEAVSTEDEFQCDVVLPTADGDTEVAMSLSMHRNIPGLADELLAEVMAIEGATPGPEHLGVSYIADTLAVSVVPCKTRVGALDEEPPVPYVFVMRAPLDTEGAATGLLDDSLTRLARETDQTYGCSPSLIHENKDRGDQTGGPTGDADDSSVTTAP